MVQAGDWQQLQWDFDPPPRENYRGMRFSFKLTKTSAAATELYLDDINFVSWEQQGTAPPHSTVHLEAGNRWNMVELTDCEQSSCVLQLKGR